MTSAKTPTELFAEQFVTYYPLFVRRVIPLEKWDRWVYQGFQVEWLIAHAQTVQEHIAAVQQCGAAFGISSQQLAKHDLSKYSDEEFPHYARQFNGDKSDPNGWARTWLHHIHHNPHHWQHWIFSEGYAPRGADAPNGVLQIPDEYLWEMLADWQGASLVYSRTTNMSEWLTKNVSRITVHSKTADQLTQILTDMGYGDVFIATGFRVPT